MDRLQYHEQILALLLGQPRLEDRDLIGLGFGHAEHRRRTVEEIGGDRVGWPADTIELAPSERLECPRLLILGMGFEQLPVGRTQLLRANSGKNALDRRPGMDRRWREGRRRKLGLCRAGRIGSRHTMIGAVEIVELRARRRAGCGE